MRQRYTQARIEFLQASQNADGGWGYFRGRHSWLEPTAYAMLALHRDPACSQAFDRAWRLMRSWQLPEGAWRPSAQVGEAHWTTALCVTLHCLKGVHDASFRKGVDWLIETTGAERSWLVRTANFLRPSLVEFDPSLSGWPWRPGTSSWIEPTAHTLTALRKAAAFYDGKQLQRRIAEGEKMILERRCRDGGWNYGNRKILGMDLKSYPESTGLALLGLLGNRSLDLTTSLQLAVRYCRETKSEFARAWLTVSLSHYGISPPEPFMERGGMSGDILLTAIETLAQSGVLG